MFIRRLLGLLLLLLLLLLWGPTVEAIYKLSLDDLLNPSKATGEKVQAPGSSGLDSTSAAAANASGSARTVETTTPATKVVEPPAAVTANPTLAPTFSPTPQPSLQPSPPPPPVTAAPPAAPATTASSSSTPAAGANSVVSGEVVTEQKPLIESARVYGAKRCRGGGCPYTASWLAHVNLYKKTGWYLTSTKMETASFNIFDRATYKFQMGDPGEYYVHHMSMFEHQLHKKFGFEVAKNLSQVMSEKAFEGECFPHGLGTDAHVKEKEKERDKGGKTHHHGHSDYLTLIPFYGGLPPDVDADFSKVRSIGQGNSLVPAAQKILQCMATVCSCNKYFGHVVIGVANEPDMELVQSYMMKVGSRIRHHTHVVLLKMEKPAHLPFHLLAWGQQFVKSHNCFHTGEHKKVKVAGGSDTNVLEICEDDAADLMAQNKNGPIEVRRMFNFRAFPHVVSNTTMQAALFSNSKWHEGAVGGKDDVKHLLHKPFRFVYYTEMDQILRFDSDQTLLAISAASNSSCFFSGRRREKNRDSSPEDYMGQLTSWRECGEAGYSFTYPTDILVRQDKG